MLSQDQIEAFHRDGFLIIEKYASPEELSLLKASIQDILSEHAVEEQKIFTTDNQQDHLDEYFLESSGRIRCFFEEEAFGPEGGLKMPLEKSVNKIGHALHELHPAFERFSYKPALYQAATALGLKRPSLVQSQYIFKQASIGGKVDAHIDSTFIYTEPPSCLGAWVALEDANIANGCLHVIPGSHLTNPLHKRFVRNKEGRSTSFLKLKENGREWGFDSGGRHWRALEVKAGTMVLLHGELVHASPANRSANTRQAYVLHLASLDCHWPEDNWLQRPATIPFREMKKVIEVLNRP